MKRFLERLADSPLLFIGLLLLIATMGAALYRTETAPLAPAIKNYDWQEHPEAVLIFYRGNCCGVTAVDWLEESRTRNVDLIIVATKMTRELQLLQKHAASKHVAIRAGLPASFMNRYSPGDTTTIMRIRSDRITRRAGGAFPSLLFEEERR